MAEPVVVDVRAGLTQAVLDGLRQAERVSFAVKDMRTAVLGYWIGDQLTIALIDSDPLFNLTRVDANALATEGRFMRRVVRGTPRLLGVVADLSVQPDDGLWQRILGALRAGDRLRLAHDADKPGLVQLQVFAQRARVASFRLPRAGQAKSAA